jgi:AcrR family transcriptional regulator
MTEYAGKGDARRSMALLWGRCEPPTRGPKQGLSVERIAATAIALADDEGIDAVSMRKVGERLGTSAMALYTYVPAKTELIDVMLDTALGELPTTYDRTDGWRAAAEAWARATWAFYQRHPWYLQISVARPLLGPNELAGYEAQLTIFDGLGLTGLEIGWVVGSMASFVGGASSALAHARAAEPATGKTDDEWWYERSALLEEMTDDVDWSERYPTTTKLSEQHAFEQPHREPGDATGYMERDALDNFEFGLARLLDGIEALVVQRASPTKGRPQRRRAKESSR